MTPLQIVVLLVASVLVAVVAFALVWSHRRSATVLLVDALSEFRLGWVVELIWGKDRGGDSERSRGESLPDSDWKVQEYIRRSRGGEGPVDSSQDEFKST